jgi:hypothetical protein
MSAAGLLVALAVALASQEPAPGRFREAEVELVGPLGAVRCEVPGRGATRIEAGLVAGERRTVVVPIAATARDADLELVELPESAGAARWTAWLRERTSETARHWGMLPAGLRSRPWPIPPRQDGGGRVPHVAWLAALAWIPFARSLRGRRVALAALSAAACAAIVAAAGGSGRPRELRVVEIDGATGISLVVEAGRDRVAVPREPPLYFATVPEHAPVEAELDLAGGPWKLAARGVTFLRWTEPVLAERERLVQRLGGARFEAAWTRSADGVWTAEGDGTVADPPGWLNPALPLGVRARIGKLAPDPEHPGRETWVRMIGG